MILGLLLWVGFASAQDAQAPKADASELVGVWKVDLRPAPGAPEYFQTFEVRMAHDGELRGTFYDSEIQDARTNADWGRVHFAFVTGDGSGAYHTSGELFDGRLRGTTHSIGRKFLAVWTAERVE